jgi:hypothetical protein
LELILSDRFPKIWIEKVTNKIIKKEEKMMRKTLDPGELTALLPV